MPRTTSQVSNSQRESNLVVRNSGYTPQIDAASQPDTMSPPLRGLGSRAFKAHISEDDVEMIGSSPASRNSDLHLQPVAPEIWEWKYSLVAKADISKHARAILEADRYSSNRKCAICTRRKIEAEAFHVQVP